jgi:hypothetical protein
VDGPEIAPGRGCTVTVVVAGEDIVEQLSKSETVSVYTPAAPVVTPEIVGLEAALLNPPGPDHE